MLVLWLAQLELLAKPDPETAATPVLAPLLLEELDSLLQANDEKLDNQLPVVDDPLGYHLDYCQAVVLRAEGAEDHIEHVAAIFHERLVGLDGMEEVGDGTWGEGGGGGFAGGRERGVGVGAAGAMNFTAFAAGHVCGFGLGRL